MCEAELQMKLVPPTHEGWWTLQMINVTMEAQAEIMRLIFRSNPVVPVHRVHGGAGGWLTIVFSNCDVETIRAVAQRFFDQFQLAFYECTTPGCPFTPEQIGSDRLHSTLRS